MDAGFHFHIISVRVVLHDASFGGSGMGHSGDPDHRIHVVVVLQDIHTDTDMRKGVWKVFPGIYSGKNAKVYFKSS